MGYRDLREWMERAEGLGELQRIRGAHWNLEIGTLTEMVRVESPSLPPSFSRIFPITRPTHVS